MDVWHRLDNFKCPIEGCKSQKKACVWHCDKDGSVIQLSQSGIMKCSHLTGSLPAHSGPVCYWRWDCGKNGNHHFTNFKDTDCDSEGFIFALSHAVQLTEQAGAAWVASLCFQLDEQYSQKSSTKNISQRTQSAQFPIMRNCQPEPVAPQSTEDQKEVKGTCSVCMEKQINAVLIPCGHSICMDDALRLQAMNGKCHMCKTKFTHINKLFLN